MKIPFNSAYGFSAGPGSTASVIDALGNLSASYAITASYALNGGGGGGGSGTSGTSGTSGGGGSSYTVLYDSRQSTYFETYIGKADSGSLQADPVWYIRRTKYTTSGSVYEVAQAINVSWNDRLTATYTII